MNRYLRKAEEIHLRKEASVSLAAGVHAAQSAITNRLLRNKKFGQSVGTHATSGFLGKEVPKNAFREASKGILSPEAAILQREAYHAGFSLRKILEAKGIPLESISKRDAVQLRRLSRGEFNKVIAEGGTEMPVVQAFMKSMEDSKRIPKGALKKLTTIDDPVKRKAALDDLEKMWKDKSNPLTSNILSNITRPGKDVKTFKTGSGRDSTKEMVTANVPMALADPLTAGINAAKAAVASDKASGIKAVATAKKKVADLMISNPAQKAYEKGLQGKGLAAGGALNTITSNVISPVSGQSSKLGSEVGQIVRKHLGPNQK